MERKVWPIVGVIAVLMAVLTATMSGCGGAAPATTTAPPPTGADETEARPAGTQEAAIADETAQAAILQDDYEDALSVRNQLALGTLRLEGTVHAVTPEQAQSLVMLWQALKTLSTDSTAAEEEVAAVQDQIVKAMTETQLQAIAAMRLTNDDLNQFYAEQGLEIPTPSAESTPGGLGKNSGMSPEEREAAKATAQALGTPVGTGGGGSGATRRDVLMDTLIAMLESRASEP